MSIILACALLNVKCWLLESAKKWIERTKDEQKNRENWVIDMSQCNHVVISIYNFLIKFVFDSVLFVTEKKVMDNQT